MMKRATDMAAVLRVAQPTPLMGPDFDQFYVSYDYTKPDEVASHGMMNGTNWPK